MIRLISSSHSRIPHTRSVDTHRTKLRQVQMTHVHLASGFWLRHVALSYTRIKTTTFHRLIHRFIRFSRFEIWINQSGPRKTFLSPKASSQFLFENHNRINDTGFKRYFYQTAPAVNRIVIYILRVRVKPGMIFIIVICRFCLTLTR